MDIYASDAEQAEALKKWWRDNGKSVVGGIAIGLAGVFGWQSWMQHQENQQGRASYQYFQLATAARSDQLESAHKQYQLLNQEYDGNIYSLLGALEIARINVEQGQLDAAQGQLEKLLKQAKDPSLQQLARVRLARLHLAQGKLEAAEALLAQAPDDGFQGELNALRGDIALKRNDLAKARAAYQAALEQGAGNSGIIRLKLDSLGDADQQAAG